jgi:hypothetical protein
MCAPLDTAPPTLTAAIQRAHCWAEDAVAAPGREALDSVWWLSTHLAAVQRAVHPVAARTLAQGPVRVATQRRRAAGIIRSLWTLEHALTGDARVRRPVADVVRQLAASVAEHAAAEDALVAELSEVLPDALLVRVLRRYADSVRRAPTRPHPVAAVHPALAAVTFRIEGHLDRVRDVLDGRHTARRLAG